MSLPRPNRRRRVLRLLIALPLLLCTLYLLLYLLHRPFRAAAQAAHFERVAHRGVHQTYSREGLDNQTCTATRIDPPRHGLLENTPQSVAAALAAGADRIEVDVHRTTDGHLVVFHDWTVDCRTDGRGETRRHSLAELKRLDIGYGYTADGGATFPFRGQFVGAMPTLAELLQQFPQARFVIDQKDPSANVTASLVQLLQQQGPEAIQRVCLSSRAERNREFVAALGAGACVWADKRAILRCYQDYLAAPLRFSAPPSCANQTLQAPDWFVARLAWGWPGTFVERMHAVGSRVLIRADDPARAAHYRALGFDGVWTDRIELWADTP